MAAQSLSAELSGAETVATWRPQRVTGVRVPFLVGAAVAALQVAIIAPFLGRYGWDRDELYFLSASKRLTWGYVDFPPATAAVGWLVHATAGDSLVGLRLTCVTALAATIFLVALMARELGGDAVAQGVAALVWAFMPYSLGAGSIFHPTWFDLLCWVALLYVVLLVLTRDEPRLWLVAGVVAGIGLETKYTIVFLLGTLLVAFLVAGRHVLATPWPWLGLLIALVLWAPNLVWQAQHGWPSLEFFGSQNEKTADDTPPLTYVAQQLFLGGGLVFAVIGVVRLWRTRLLRPLAVVPPVVTLFFLLERGRAYYPIPADSIAIAAGAVAFVDWIRRGRRLRLASLVPILALEAAVLVLAVPLVLPVRSTASMVSSGVWEDSFYKDELGWPELADQTARAWASLPADERARTAIVAGNYGEASALERYGPSRGLPPVVSGHLSWRYWRPAKLPQRRLLLVGYDAATLRFLCATWRKLATIDNRWRIANEERGRLVATCVLSATLDELWERDFARNDL
jgi:hypothetical protein